MKRKRDAFERSSSSSSSSGSCSSSSGSSGSGSKKRTAPSPAESASTRRARPPLDAGLEEFYDEEMDNWRLGAEGAAADDDDGDDDGDDDYVPRGRYARLDAASVGRIQARQPRVNLCLAVGAARRRSGTAARMPPRHQRLYPPPPRRQRPRRHAPVTRPPPDPCIRCAYCWAAWMFLSVRCIRSYPGTSTTSDPPQVARHCSYFQFC